MENRSQNQFIAVALITFAIAVFSRSIAQSVGPYWAWVQSLPDPIRWLEQPTRWTLICIAGLWVAHRARPREVPKQFGLTASPWTGLAVTFIACSPMLVIPAILALFGIGGIRADFSWVEDLAYGAIIWPLGEEILFRGYAFRQLHRYGRIGLWPAAILIGVIFGVLHLGQAAVKDLPLAGELGAVAIVSIGGILFAWLFAKWDDNLWVPLGAHLFMNLWWSVFGAGDSPVGGWLGNIARVLAVVLLIVITLRRDRLPAVLRAPQAAAT